MTEKLRYLQQKKFNTADELRDRLTRLEGKLAKIKQIDQSEASAVLSDMDRASQIIDNLTASGVNLAPEVGRFGSIERRLRKNAKPFLKVIGGPAILQQNLPTPPPSATHWWWQIDQIVAAHRRQRQRRMMLTAAVVLLVIAGITIAMQTVFAPDPAVIARVNAENQAFTALSAGDSQAALAAIETGLVDVPGEANLLLFKAVLLDVLGDETTSAEVAEQAMVALADPVTFHLSRARLELQLNRPQKAEEQSRLALELDETSAIGWFVLGQTREAQNDRVGAVNAYEKAAALAENNDDSELVVMIRMSMARLMMGPGG
jgi:tetratricopeptide (TPR) repeat protein